ncbi:MAG: hypothetical protein GY814_04675 [Gammaproteobacteria bacterium]|nr:hypothetical protein [Gammaproteobacteria bacterium]
MQKCNSKSWILFVTLMMGVAAYPTTAVSFDININPLLGLAGNTDAVAAFERAASQWESRISDQITVNIDANLTNFGSASIIGSTSSTMLFGGYGLIRDQMVADAGNELDDGVVAYLPDASQFSAYLPAGIGLSGNIVASKANLKAMGFSNLDTGFGITDAEITFNSEFVFDFDNSDGVNAGAMDFESVAAHEIGHALGFISAVDTIDWALNEGLTGNVHINPLDFFRFDDLNDPETLSEFTNNSRNLVPGDEAFFDDLMNEFSMSTGAYTGDGRQVSHWKDDLLTGTMIGAMDPTIDYGEIFTLSEADFRVLDLIGYEIVSVPIPAAVWLFSLASLV